MTAAIADPFDPEDQGPKVFWVDAEVTAESDLTAKEIIVDQCEMFARAELEVWIAQH